VGGVRSGTSTRRAAERPARSGRDAEDALRVKTGSRGGIPVASPLAVPAVCAVPMRISRNRRLAGCARRVSGRYLDVLPRDARRTRPAPVIGGPPRIAVRGDVPDAHRRTRFERLLSLLFFFFCFFAPSSARERRARGDTTRLRRPSHGPGAAPTPHAIGATAAAAWRYAQDELPSVGPSELCVHAEMLYLIESPLSDEAFFPRSEHAFWSRRQLRQMAAIEAIGEGTA